MNEMSIASNVEWNIWSMIELCLQIKYFWRFYDKTFVNDKLLSSGSFLSFSCNWWRFTPTHFQRTQLLLFVWFVKLYWYDWIISIMIAYTMLQLKRENEKEKKKKSLQSIYRRQRQCLNGAKHARLQNKWMWQNTNEKTYTA